LAYVGDADVPLCVDLDGSLTNADTLHELMMTALRTQPAVLLRVPGWLARGKAVMKEELAARIALDPAALPYNASLIGYLEDQRRQGRRLVLATATDRRVAQAVARHLGLFDEVIASDGVHNLRGPAKAAALVQRFGEGGFDYAGNDSTDFDVWAKARRAVVVNASGGVIRTAKQRHDVATVIEDRRPFIASLIRALRPHQWAKNVLVFVPLIASGALGDWNGLSLTLLAFFALCATASGVYVTNDLLDLSADRVHHRKRFRPFAHGDLSIGVGLALLPVLFAIGFGLAAAAGVLGIVIGYALLSSLYSIKLKELPLVDVFMLALLYTIRIFAGGLASGHYVSLWLLAFSCFIFLSLGFVKRVAELAPLLQRGGSTAARRGYFPADTMLLSIMGVASSFISGMVLSLYIQNLAQSPAYGNPALLWAAVPLLLFWQCRLWLSTARGYMHDDPLVYAMRDWVSWIVGGLLIIAVLLAKFTTVDSVPGLIFT
jgi:4-hydroxybenzoate polyprenyltransferase/phosphoserine phosphatase